ncbi:MAG TPA: TonB-dependent receptor [Opitutaceae bacterium]|nr:TonB-dependent receptor [Opitutaceae bacterium]
MTLPRLRFFAALLLAPLALSAQTDKSAAPAATPGAEEKKDEPLKLEAVEVTGTRLRLSAGEAPAVPVLTLSRVELEELGVNRLADIRQAIPQLQPSVGFNDNLVNSGPSRGQQVSTTFNLRGLGNNSTLVLIDGHRVPHSGQEAPGGAGGREDFNVDGIPVSAIERVEILPQGASAVYGSEAMAGVVNIILKKNYTGAELSVNYDNSFDKDVGDLSVGLTAGFSRGKLKTFLTANWEKQNGQTGADRWFTARDASFFGGSTSFINSQVAGGAGSLSSTSSPLNANQAALPGLTTNVVAIPAGSKGSGLTTADYVAAGAPSAPFDPSSDTSIIDPATRRSVVFKADYAVAPLLEAYAELRWSRFKNEFTSTPQTLSISLPAGYAGNPFSSAVFLRKVFFDLPRYHQDSYQENSGLVLGARGHFLDQGVAGGKFLKAWRYDASANFTRNVIDDLITTNTFNTTALAAAMSDPNPASRPILAYDSSRPGNNPNAPGVLEKFLVPAASHHHDYTDVDQYTFQADGAVWAGWAGDIKAAVGGEASQEKVHFHRDAGDSSLAFTLTKPFSRRLTAVFAELSVPLLAEKQHVPLVHRLEAGTAVRAEDFSDVGSHRTPQYNALYQPVSWLSFRASRAEGFKVARLYDLQAPIFTSTATLTTASNVHDTLRGGELVLGPVTSTTGGNPALKPETSVSKNGGIVIDVPGRWFKGLTLSVDAWELHYFNKVAAPSRQVLIDYFPARVTRGAKLPGDPASYAGVITAFDTSNINYSKYDTRGVDYSASYQHATPLGPVSISASLSDPKTIATKSTPAATTFSYVWLPLRLAGSAFLRHGAWSAGTTMSYQAPYRLSTSPTGSAYPSMILWNPQVSYDFGRDKSFGRHADTWWRRALAEARVSLTIPNAFHADPELADKLNGRIVYDPRLTRYVINLSKKL